MLVALQLEQERAQPRQVPLASTKPLAQARQSVAVVQLMQFLVHVLLQVPLRKTWAGGQLVQLVAEPLQVRQPLQRRQLELAARKDPGMQV
jgi:hypothetical protein